MLLSLLFFATCGKVDAVQTINYEATYISFYLSGSGSQLQYLLTAPHQPGRSQESCIYFYSLDYKCRQHETP